jgi:hypothetical protein
VLRDCFEVKDKEIEELLKECTALSKILAASVLSLKRDSFWF